MLSDLTHDLEKGTLIDGRYEVVEPLGMGASGSVYRAWDPNTKKFVALKMLHADVGEEEDVRLRFEREARALWALTHPHIVPTLGFGVHGRAPYLVLDFLQGQTLMSILRTEAPLDTQRALRLAAQVLDAVAFAHKQGIIHRDLKSPNILITVDEQGSEHAWMLDFGLAKFFDKEKWSDEHTLTAQGEIFGTPGYMSPEQASGAKLDARTDVYALGILLFELLTGRRPFVSKNRTELFKMHFLAPVPALTEVRPDLQIPPHIDALIHKALSKKADDRFEDAVMMKAAFDGALPVGEVNQSKPNPLSTFRLLPRNVRILFGFGLVVALILLATLVFVLVT